MDASRGLGQPTNRPAVAALELGAVTRAFDGLVAVDHVTLTVPESERRAIIGPNGAGKTTLFNIIAGDLPATAGAIMLLGKDVTRQPIHQRVAAGLARTYQITNLFPASSVADNVRLAALGLTRTKYQMFRPVPRAGWLQDRVERVLELVGLPDRAAMPARNLSHGEQRQLEVGLALASEPRVLLLDEPAAGLAATERAMMFELIRRLPPSLTVLIIEHDMDLVLQLVRWVTCLHNGRVIADDSPDAIVKNTRVQEVYLGAAG
jgi:branched-chain amino acid transport system ATP-binding protein